MDKYIIQNTDSSVSPNVPQPINIPDLGKSLLNASRNGDVEEVKSLLNNGAPFATDWLGMSPLHFAAMNGHLTTCEALLNAGFSRDARTKVDRTPLQLAAQEGHADIVELLLKSAADIHAVDTLKMTALHWAAERGHYPVIQVLMRFGANIHRKNKFELTPLEIAELRGHTEAKDAMLMTQVEVNPAVGKMAAPNEDLADPTAFIITDEETVIPAAPPADEVIISSVKAEPNTDEMSVGASDPLLTGDNKETLLDWVVSGFGGKGVVETNQSSFPHLTPTDQYFGSSNKPDRTSFESQFLDGLDLSFQALESNNLTHLSSSPNDNSMLVVETPDGKVLYVRQEDNENHSKITIFNKDGELVDDDDLLEEVTTALSGYQNREDVGANFLDTLDEDKLLKSDDLPVSDLLSGVEATELDRESDKGMLLQQLVHFAKGGGGMGSSLCVDGAPELPTKKKLVSWFGTLGLTVAEFQNFEHFTVSFTHEDSEFSLHASYCLQSRSITFNH
ncbi:GA repeat binding protein beta 2 [Echinococcus multilocularis]|uniref:GA repeat binding protein beta 2 n=1 Tax=Echinococcus multilocularis TaxID=6211 RepID=A0A087VYX1_ECHMU|nr:GA repeat binding protein beta 2 [Echinococcus multilocularis]